jgi:hypothetical protein
MQSIAAFPSRDSAMELTDHQYQLLVEAIEVATAIDELAVLPKEIRMNYAGDERVAHRSAD